jgi:hypothetical protein
MDVGNICSGGVWVNDERKFHIRYFYIVYLRDKQNNMTYISAEHCLEKFGMPDTKFEERWMVVYSPPASFSMLPTKIYMNRMMVPRFAMALDIIEQDGLIPAIKTWNGCFNVRKTRGRETFSLHSWGVAFDINAATNALGTVGDMSPELIAVFESCRFHWGGNWKRPDPQHFQLAVI